MRERLVNEVEHFGHMLPDQGPMSVFIHHNTLHGMQHLHFEEAVAEGTRVLGGCGYSTNEEFRSHYRAGRISDEDIAYALGRRPQLASRDGVAALPGRTIQRDEIVRAQLIHGIERCDPGQLRFEVFERDATRRFRDEVPAETRAAIAERVAGQLTRGLEAIGQVWTLADWFRAHTNLDLPGYLRREVEHTVAGDPPRPKRRRSERELRRLRIPKWRWDSYLGCIDRQLDAVGLPRGEGREAARERWLVAERRLLKRLADAHFGTAGSFSAISEHFQQELEAYAVSSLWHACLASCGLEDPLSPTNPHDFRPQGPEGRAELLQQDYRQMERWGGPPLQLDEQLRTDVLRTTIQVLVEVELVEPERDPAALESEHRLGPEAARLCRLVLHDLSKTELNRRGYYAFGDLLSLREEQGAGPPEWAVLRERLRERDPRVRRLEASRSALNADLDGLGRAHSHVELLEALTGQDLGLAVDEYLIKRCGAFLDEGLAAWRMPGRVLGFYDAWRGLAMYDLSSEFEDLPGWGEQLEKLPEAAEDAVIEHLRALGIDEERWGDYLGRVLTRLPGWAGMINWRAHQPGYARQEVQPADLMHYLAVRLFYERLLVERVCRTAWGLDTSVASLRAYFGEHLSEYFVRRELYRGGLPEDLAQRARTLVERRRLRRNGSAEWEILADLAWAHRQSGASEQQGHTVPGSAWRLFQLAQVLGLTADEVRWLAPDERDGMLRILDEFPASSHGPVWQLAFERHYREQIMHAVAANRGRGRWQTRATRPASQIVFCIDEREEAIRRHLEEVEPGCETLGAAGFFGVAMNYRGLHDHGSTPRCPPAVTPAHRVREVPHEDETRFERHDRRAKWSEIFHDAYWEVKRNGVSAYFMIDFVGSLQTLPLFMRVLSPRRYTTRMEKLGSRIVPPVRTALTLDATPGSDNGHDGAQPLGFQLVEQVDRIEALLRNIGLTSGLARLVVLCGHGSTSLNNPHESAHDCGACGGQHGGPSARAFATLANRPAVREMLRERGIEIPADTWFVASQHDTCSERITYYDLEDVPDAHREDLEGLLAAMEEARRRSAHERCRRFPGAPKDAPLERSLRHIEGRSMDLSQVRPEWGHCTNAMAVVGRRSLTQGLFLDRRAFLVSYDPREDADGSILERILLAIGPVASGISLEYYFSTVDNAVYGCDTKVPHNVSGMVGVMGGAMSDLRTGLPMQMIEIHEPMRLLVMVDASPTTLAEVYGRHEILQQLLGNEWMQLVAVNPRTGKQSVFVPPGEFVEWDTEPHQLPVVESSADWYRGQTDYLPPAMVAPNQAPLAITQEDLARANGQALDGAGSALRRAGLLTRTEGKRSARHA